MPWTPGPRVSRAAWPCGAPCRAMAVVVMCGTALCGTATASSAVHGPSGMSSVGTTGTAAAASGGVLSTAVATTELLGAPITAACNAHPLDNAGVSHCSVLYYMHPLLCSIAWWNSCWHLSHLPHQWPPPARCGHVPGARTQRRHLYMRTVLVWCSLPWLRRITTVCSIHQYSVNYFPQMVHVRGF